jgi:hypothetical protein
MHTRALALVLFVACAPKVGDKSDAGVTDASPLDAFEGPFADFPTDPILDPTGTGVPPDSTTLFGDPTTGAQSGGPCLTEPEVGTLYPNNWLRPRFSWVPVGGENLFEIRLSAANQASPLVVYTSATTWTMPAAIWIGLAEHTVDQPITISIRGATLSGGTLSAPPALGSKGTIQVASAKATGAIVYWTTSGGTGLRGFTIGEETVHDIVRPADASTVCVGCHSSTPDGTYVGFSASAVATDGSPATMSMLSADGNKITPPFISASAATLMARQQQQAPTFSKQHWTTGDHAAVSMFPITKTTTKIEMIWTDLETASTAEGVGWGVLARTGDDNSAAGATFAHTTDTLLYTSAPTVSSGVTTTQGNLATVPYNNRLGGTAQLVPGASSSSFNEYYPTYAPDDELIAFNRVAQDATSYNNPNAEVYVIPAAGNGPVRLAANDPPACSGKTSPGVTNSWPKWSPGTSKVGGKQYYWLTFSSTRSANGNPQLYVTPVITQGNVISTFPALYLWNQPADENNHTPAWDDFAIVQ